ncbi:MAG: anaerobic ribonucleoside-triphosphate reductase activating protein [Paraclostridium sp.]
MKYAKMMKYDTANGQGIRVTLFVSGCTHGCEGCFNEKAQNFNYGHDWDLKREEEFMTYVRDSKVVGVNILGGEPMQQIKDKDLLRLLMRIKVETKKSIWMWTGYTLEELLLNNNRAQMFMLSLVDVLIDGRFEKDKKDLSLKYRGSSNQRVINVPASIIEEEVILLKID